MNNFESPRVPVELKSAMDGIATVFKNHPHLQPRIGMEAPDGWSVVVLDSLHAILDLEKVTGSKIAIAQVKEKFGGLRFYASAAPVSQEVAPDTEFSHPLLKLAFANELKEKQSKENEGVTADAVTVGRLLRLIIGDAEDRVDDGICQSCGGPGVMRSGGYMFISCDAHSHGRRAAKTISM